MLMPKIARPSCAIAESRRIPRIQVCDVRTSRQEPEEVTGRRHVRKSSTQAYLSYAFSLLTEVTPTTRTCRRSDRAIGRLGRTCAQEKHDRRDGYPEPERKAACCGNLRATWTNPAPS